MEVRARLIATRLPEEPAAAVVVLHGGGGRRGTTVVSPTQPSVLRMVPIAKRLAHAGRGRLAVFRLLNSTRGWNPGRTPVDDVRWALERLRTEHRLDVPVSLVGHSLGGRAAILAGAHPSVSSVVALNPYLYATDGDTDLDGRSVLIVHGTDDRVADPAIAAAVSHALERSAHVTFVRVRGGKHAMLRRHHLFDGLAAGFVTTTLLGAPPRGALADVLAGRAGTDV
ncbi:hypothetical protein CLV56_0817 [Mumia flava]|uniref:Alpha/beta hydrolase n=1 Tax=Mumia flava TaxID=1348852 RepID=A0A0B2BPI1_9ACTN|nr:alpha/beta hydrolase [Mumia flava]PJJ56608.1 hypothetical protein CLV56_0817 [Mumia flava]